MVRTRKKYSDEVKISIYEQLASRGLRFNKLARASRKNHVTLTKYLAHGKEEGEVALDPTTSKYRLLSKGRQMLNKFQEERRRREGYFCGGFLYPRRHLSSLSVVFPPPRELDPARLDLYKHLILCNPPLIMPFRASLYGSEKLLPIIERTEDIALDVYRTKPRTLKQSLVSDILQRIGEQFFWSLVARRLGFLLEWHEYRRGRAMPKLPKRTRRMRPSPSEHPGYHNFSKPPPLSIENILGFDASVTLDFHGKTEMDQLASQGQIHQLLCRRLVGSILLRLAYDDSPLKTHGEALAQQLTASGLLKKEDASILEKLIEYADLRKFNKQESQTIYDMAFRYFEEADRLADLIAGGKEIETGGKLPSIDESSLWIRETLPSKESLGC